MFAINVWMGISGNFLIVPYELPPLLSGASYLHFLMEELPQLPTMQQIMWFMNAGAPAHFTLDIKTFLNSHHPD
jgi:hypothetical protein